MHIAGGPNDVGHETLGIWNLECMIVSAPSCFFGRPRGFFSHEAKASFDSSLYTFAVSTGLGIFGATFGMVPVKRDSGRSDRDNGVPVKRDTGRSWTAVMGVPVPI